MIPMIIDVDLTNIEQYPPRCFLNPKNEGYKRKLEWLKRRFKEGLRIRVLYDEENKKDHGFIEYVSGENTWRAVQAEGYLFIHCMWISPNDWKKKGYGSRLVKECLRDAEGKLGVAVVTSDGPFMATKEIFLKNGFTIVEERGKDQLLVKQLKKGPLPRFKDYEGQIGKYKGWHIVYSDQCPWVARFIDELPSAIIADLKLKMTRLTTPSQAQNGPSIYSVFNLIHDGEILADRYISKTRFNNIVKKELGR
jgi:hypothetical protein